MSAQHPERPTPLERICASAWNALGGQAFAKGVCEEYVVFGREGLVEPCGIRQYAEARVAQILSNWWNKQRNRPADISFNAIVEFCVQKTYINMDYATLPRQVASHHIEYRMEYPQD